MRLCWPRTAALPQPSRPASISGKRIGSDAGWRGERRCGTFRLQLRTVFVESFREGTAMYCNYCGKVIQDDAAVCAYCGIRVGASVARKRLVRPRVGRKIAGVCLGCAEYFDLDVTLVRLMWLLVALMTGVGLIAYPIAWIVMPEEPLLLTAPVGAQRVANP